MADDDLAEQLFVRGGFSVFEGKICRSGYDPIAGIEKSGILALRRLSLTWEEQYERWVEAADGSAYDDRPERIVIIETRKAARHGGPLDNPEQWEWVKSALGETNRRRFVSAVFHRQAAPRALASTMLRMGVEEENPSANRLFVEPAVKAMGARRVMNRLIDLLRDGSDREKAGAASAAYWVQGDQSQPSFVEVCGRFRDEMLRQFIATDSVYVRQRIISSLSMKTEDYSPDVAKLLPTAIRIARGHFDPYIRHRIEVQLGEEGLLRPLPS